MRLAWLTDPHLDFLSQGGAEKFGQDVAEETDCDAVLITGDIAKANSLKALLNDFSTGLDLQIYFVLGNHDYYNGSIKKVQKLASSLNRNKKMCWLDRNGVVELSKKVALVGHQGWYDAWFGDPWHSNVWMQDFDLIEDFTYLHDRESLIDRLRSIGEAAAKEVKQPLFKALGQYQEVVFATHYPPFKEACWHEGYISDNNWLPWFTSKSMGRILLEGAQLFEGTQITVLCGHTHSGGFTQILPNLGVITGKAKYRAPEIEQVFEF